MVIGILQLALRLPEAQSLKEKRWVLKSLLTRIRNKFNVSVSEIDQQDFWQAATVAAAHVGASREYTNEVLDQIVNFVKKERNLELIDSQLELI